MKHGTNTRCIYIFVQYRWCCTRRSVYAVQPFCLLPKPIPNQSGGCSTKGCFGCHWYRASDKVFRHRQTASNWTAYEFWRMPQSSGIKCNITNIKDSRSASDIKHQIFINKCFQNVSDYSEKCTEKTWQKAQTFKDLLPLQFVPYIFKINWGTITTLELNWYSILTHRCNKYSLLQGMPQNMLK